MDAVRRVVMNKFERSLTIEEQKILESYLNKLTDYDTIENVIDLSVDELRILIETERNMNPFARSILPAPVISDEPPQIPVAARPRPVAAVASSSASAAANPPPTTESEQQRIIDAATQSLGLPPSQSLLAQRRLLAAASSARKRPRPPSPPDETPEQKLERQIQEREDKKMTVLSEKIRKAESRITPADKEILGHDYEHLKKAIKDEDQKNPAYIHFLKTILGRNKMVAVSAFIPNIGSKPELGKSSLAGTSLKISPERTDCYEEEELIKDRDDRIISYPLKYKSIEYFCGLKSIPTTTNVFDALKKHNFFHLFENIPMNDMYKDKCAELPPTIVQSNRTLNQLKMFLTKMRHLNKEQIEFYNSYKNNSEVLKSRYKVNETKYVRIHPGIVEKNTDIIVFIAQKHNMLLFLKKHFKVRLSKGLIRFKLNVDNKTLGNIGIFTPRQIILASTTLEGFLTNVETYCVDNTPEKEKEPLQQPNLSGIQKRLRGGLYKRMENRKELNKILQDLSITYQHLSTHQETIDTYNIFKAYYKNDFNDLAVIQIPQVILGTRRNDEDENKRVLQERMISKVWYNLLDFVEFQINRLSPDTEYINISNGQPKQYSVIEINNIKGRFNKIRSQRISPRSRANELRSQKLASLGKISPSSSESDFTRDGSSGSSGSSGTSGGSGSNGSQQNVAPQQPYQPQSDIGSGVGWTTFEGDPPSESESESGREQLFETLRRL